ncbi:MAG TPA: glycosyltransferase family 2 protein [Candidatus Dormibacteraeota bacterium]
MSDLDRGQGLRVIIPCLDEERAIGPLVAAVRAGLDAARDRVIVVDNGSRDGTAAVAREAGAEVVSEPHRGYGRACLAGVLSAGDGVAVFLDGDGADRPEDLALVVAPILEGTADLVVGARRDREAGSMTPFQRYGNRVATALISAACHARVTDLGPMRAIRIGRLLALDPSARTYGWSTEMTVKALRAGYRYLEVPVGHRRRVGVSKVSGTLTGSLRAGARILWTAMRCVRWRPAESGA